eukprot:3940302-Rhodomonas_salina.2
MMMQPPAGQRTHTADREVCGMCGEGRKAEGGCVASGAGLHSAIEDEKLQFHYILCQECGFLCLISGCKRGV